MANHDIERWRPGDRFVIREPTTNGVPEPRFFEVDNMEFPDPQSFTIYIPRENVDLTIIYTVTAVYEDTNWTFLRFDNKEEDFFGRRQDQHVTTMEGETRVELAASIFLAQELVNLVEGPSESLWITARHMEVPYCRKVRIIAVAPRRSTRPTERQDVLRQRSRSPTNTTSFP